MKNVFFSHIYPLNIGIGIFYFRFFLHGGLLSDDDTVGSIQAFSEHGHHRQEENIRQQERENDYIYIAADFDKEKWP